MAILNPRKLSAQISAIGKGAEKFAEVVQEALISCAYYSMKDGNVTPFNDLLEAVGDGTRRKGLTVWAELFAPVHIRQGSFALSKGAAKAIHVTCEEDFAEFEADMRAAPRWDKIAGKEPVRSLWDSGRYLDGVYKRLDKQGEHELVRALKDAELAYRVKRNGDVLAVEVPALPAPQVA